MKLKITRKQLRQIILQEVRIKPTLPANIPESHAEKIYAILDRGKPEDINQAKSLLDALGAPPSFLNDYMEYLGVGDLEKLGNKYAQMSQSSEIEAVLGRTGDYTKHFDTMGDLDAKASELGKEKALKDFPVPEGGDDPQSSYDRANAEYRHHRRYFDSRNRLGAGGMGGTADQFLESMIITKRQLRSLISEAINEHRIMPDISSVPPQHLDKIHDLIDKGDVETARSLIDAFGGPTDYPEAYIAYGEVGDMEKLGGKAAELLDRPPSGAHILDDMKPIYDIDDEARALADEKALRDFPAEGFGDDFPTDEVILPDQYSAQQMHLDRYYNARNRVHDEDNPFK